jgi:hypothetical protein
LASPRAGAEGAVERQRLVIAGQRGVAVITELLHVADGLPHIGFASGIAAPPGAVQRSLQTRQHF